MFMSFTMEEYLMGMIYITKTNLSTTIELKI
jgi:hypothetical protein